jgi:hypothetical protein
MPLNFGELDWGVDYFAHYLEDVLPDRLPAEVAVQHLLRLARGSLGQSVFVEEVAEHLPEFVLALSDPHNVGSLLTALPLNEHLNVLFEETPGPLLVALLGQYGKILFLQGLKDH